MPLLFLIPLLGLGSAYVYKTVSDETQQTLNTVNRTGPNLIVYGVAAFGLYMAWKAVK